MLCLLLFAAASLTFGNQLGEENLADLADLATRHNYTTHAYCTQERSTLTHSHPSMKRRLEDTDSHACAEESAFMAASVAKSLRIELRRLRRETCETVIELAASKYALYT